MSFLNPSIASAEDFPLSTYTLAIRVELELACLVCYAILGFATKCGQEIGVRGESGDYVVLWARLHRYRYRPDLLRRAIPVELMAAHDS